MSSPMNTRSIRGQFRGVVLASVAVAVIGLTCCADVDSFSHGVAAFARATDGEAADHHESHQGLCATGFIEAPSVAACGGSVAVPGAVPALMALMSRATRSASLQTSASVVPRAAPLFLLHQSLLI